MSGALSLAAVASWLLPTYLVALCVYRLYLHPLAKVPGPALAAMTGWYEAYFELLHKGVGGQYTFHIKAMHAEYGPIVRINPHEVHIDDPNFHSTVYTNAEGLDKPRHWRWRFGTPAAIFSTPEHGLHRMRRASQEHFFARGRILKLSPMLQAKAAQMCARLVEDFASQGRPVTMDRMFACYLADVIALYSFNRDFNWLGCRDFRCPLLETIDSFKRIAHPCGQFPWLARVLVMMPDAVLQTLQPAMSAVMAFHDEMRNMVRTAQQDVRSEEPKQALIPYLDQAPSAPHSNLTKEPQAQEECVKDIVTCNQEQTTNDVRLKCQSEVLAGYDHHAVEPRSAGY